MICPHLSFLTYMPFSLGIAQLTFSYSLTTQASPSASSDPDSLDFCMDYYFKTSRPLQSVLWFSYQGYLLYYPSISYIHVLLMVIKFIDLYIYLLIFPSLKFNFLLILVFTYYFPQYRFIDTWIYTSTSHSSSPILPSLLFSSILLQ